MVTPGPGEQRVQRHDPAQLDPQAVRDEVASRVMGWSLETRQWAYSDRAELWHAADGTPRLTRFAWRPDENDAQNMQVLDRMLELGFEYTLAANTEGVRAAFVQPAHGADPLPDVFHPNRRLAVLLAALCACAQADA